MKAHLVSARADNRNKVSRTLSETNSAPNHMLIGFTLMELLVVLAIIAILASLLFPVLMKAKAMGLQIKCVTNLKQLGLAWTMYLDDNNDVLPPCNCLHNFPRPQDMWVGGMQDLWWDDNSDNTNTSYLTRSLLAPYLKGSIRVWKCPSDKSTCKEGKARLPLVRSFSMNSWLNTTVTTDHMLVNVDHYRSIKRISDMRDPPPNQTFVILEERADSIDDAWFGVLMILKGNRAMFWNVPASYHNGAGNLFFADGHVESHKWKDPKTTPPVRDGVNIAAGGRSGVISPLASPNNPDIEWLQNHATGLK